MTFHTENGGFCFTVRSWLLAELLSFSDSVPAKAQIPSHRSMIPEPKLQFNTPRLTQQTSPNHPQTRREKPDRLQNLWIALRFDSLSSRWGTDITGLQRLRSPSDCFFVRGWGVQVSKFGVWELGVDASFREADSPVRRCTPPAVFAWWWFGSSANRQSKAILTKSPLDKIPIHSQPTT